MVRVAAANRITAFLLGITHGSLLDLFRVSQKRLAIPLGELGEVVRTIDPLEQVVHAVGNSGHDRKAVDELIEAVTVEEQDFFPAALQDGFIFTDDPKEV